MLKVMRNAPFTKKDAIWQCLPLVFSESLFVVDYTVLIFTMPSVDV